MSSPQPTLAETLDAPVLSGRRLVEAAPLPARSTSLEDVRFLQERTALFGKVGAVLLGAALVLFFLSHTVLGIQLGWFLVGFHALAVASSACGWLLCRGKARSERFVKWVEVVTTCAVGFFSTFMLTALLPFTRPDLIAAIDVLLITTTRAILVPSSPRRTFVISALLWLDVFPVTYLAFSQPFAFEGLDPLTVRAGALIEAGIWMLLGLTLVTVTSRVIYGLRREVREAKKLGQYTLLDKLGEGGMGQVFRAQHAMLRRPTAVKLLHPDRTGGPEDLARFEREVQLTAQLTHPNVVTVFDYGRTPDGVFYYAMELLEGQNLEEIIEHNGPMTPARAVHVLVQVASALAEAHEVGLIHRDIKPANILLCARGSARDVAKVVDFGLVKQLGASVEALATGTEGASETSANGSGSVSRTGSIVGTPMYLAPEAMRDPASLDARADLYALGAVGYFLLTGTVVFGGKSVIDACRHHLHTKVELPSARLRATHPDATIPADVEALVVRCLAKAPADRPASARDLRDALLACDIADTWSEDDARKAWDTARVRSPIVIGASTETSWSAKTIAVDLAR